MARTFKLDSPLGDRLLFARLSGSEGLGELFQYQLTALSERADVRPAELLGQRLTVTMDLGEGRERHFSGHVTAMHRSVDAERGRTRYELTLRPRSSFGCSPRFTSRRWRPTTKPSGAVSSIGSAPAPADPWRPARRLAARRAPPGASQPGPGLRRLDVGAPSSPLGA